ncbi:hypothetical protein [Chlorobaculum limnaeum]|uniref:hypothetical protein n=1 Tax=Chlorobaculum limnaeum TaxID=274537 RepID=UPI001471141B|nr:hypothetical protein [Chlorobaculum limnaeum]
MSSLWELPGRPAKFSFVPGSMFGMPFSFCESGESGHVIFLFVISINFARLYSTERQTSGPVLPGGVFWLIIRAVSPFEIDTFQANKPKLITQEDADETNSSVFDNQHCGIAGAVGHRPSSGRRPLSDQ